MQLTPKQRAAVEQGERHITLNKKQQAELQAAAADEQEGRAANLAALGRRRQAELEPGFAGDLRRAITAARRPSMQLAVEVGVPVELLEDFREGQAVLPFEALTRLVNTLGLRLMAEIPG